LLGVAYTSTDRISFSAVLHSLRGNRGVF